jgi:hypothetical protein
LPRVSALQVPSAPTSWSGISRVLCCTCPPKQSPLLPVLLGNAAYNKNHPDWCTVCTGKNDKKIYKPLMRTPMLWASQSAMVFVLWGYPDKLTQT